MKWWHDGVNVSWVDAKTGKDKKKNEVPHIPFIRGS